ncbi:unnamed protein product [Urochloa humidicola]
MGTFATLCFRVLIELRGIPGHAQSLDTAQHILGSSSCNLVEAPEEMVGEADSALLFVAGWCVHPDLIPVQKLLMIPEPVEPYVECGLFLKPHELIHSKQDVMRYRVLLRVREIQDWNEESSDDDTPPNSWDSSDDEDYPGFHQGSRSFPWPKRTGFDDDDNGAGNGGGPVLGPGWGPTFVRRAPLSTCNGEMTLLAWSMTTPCRFGRLKKKQPLMEDQGIRGTSFAAAAEKLNAVASPPLPEPLMQVMPPANEGSTTDPMLLEGLVKPKACQDGAFVCAAINESDRSEEVSSVHSLIPKEADACLAFMASHAATGSTGQRRMSTMHGPVHNGPTSHVRPDGPSSHVGPDGPDEANTRTSGRSSSPTFEAIQFGDIDLPSLPASSPTAAYVTTTRGSMSTLPFHLLADASTPVKRAVSGFVSLVAKQNPMTCLVKTSPTRKSIAPGLNLNSAMRRSERLAALSGSRAPKPEIQAQNVLMRKLGITSNKRPPDASAFKKFVSVFKSPLHTPQRQSMNAVFPLSAPSIGAMVDDTDC